MTILVCDDDKEIVDAIEIYLIQEGYFEVIDILITPYLLADCLVQ